MEFNSQITTLIGWCAVINILFLFLAFLIITLMPGSITKIHAKLFNLNKTDLPAMYFQYLGQLKILILVFNVAPYIALKLVL